MKRFLRVFFDPTWPDPHAPHCVWVWQLKLKASVSKLRLSNASFLVYSLVDSLVNEMQLTLQHYLNLVSTASFHSRQSLEAAYKSS